MFVMPELPPGLRRFIEATNPIPDWVMLFITVALVASLTVWVVS
jgi:hypothetical protein